MYDSLQQEIDDYRQTLADYRALYEEDGSISSDEQMHLDALEEKISQVLEAIGPQSSSNGNGYASSSAIRSMASSSGANMRVVPGAGGYEYEQHADGAIFIVKSPQSGVTRIEVQKGTTAYNAILAEIGPFPSSGAPDPSRPEPPDDDPKAGLPPTGDGAVDPGYGNGQEVPPGAVPASLEQLMAKEELTADEIAEARRLIAEQPQELQGGLYEQLQEKAEYYNQRNNDCSQETSTGGTCNLIAVAMALQYLGVKNPYPEMDFDEALVKIATDENMGAITSVDTWTKVAAKLGVKDVTVFASSVKQKRSWWEQTVDNGYLKKGYGVVMSLDGHVVRLQAVTDAGLVVDDPYGASKLSGRTFDDNGDGVADRPKYSFTDSNDGDAQDGDEAANSGDDTGYPWADVEKYTFKYLVALK